MCVPVHDGVPALLRQAQRLRRNFRGLPPRQSAALEKKHRRIGHGFHRQGVSFLIRPAEQIAGQVEGDDASTAVCENLAASFTTPLATRKT